VSDTEFYTRLAKADPTNPGVLRWRAAMAEAEQILHEREEQAAAAERDRLVKARADDRQAWLRQGAAERAALAEATRRERVLKQVGEEHERRRQHDARLAEAMAKVVAAEQTAKVTKATPAAQPQPVIHVHNNIDTTRATKNVVTRTDEDGVVTETRTLPLTPDELKESTT